VFCFQKKQSAVSYRTLILRINKDSSLGLNISDGPCMTKYKKSESLCIQTKRKVYNLKAFVDHSMLLSPAQVTRKLSPQSLGVYDANVLQCDALRQHRRRRLQTSTRSQRCT